MIASDNHLDNLSDGSTPIDFDEDSISLLDLWALAWRRKGIIAFGILAGIGLAILYYYTATPQYESEVEILVTQKDSDMPTQQYNGPTTVTRAEELLATHIQIFQSPRIIRQAIEKRGLNKLPSVAKLIQEKGNPVDYIAKNLSVTRGGEGKAKEAHVLSATFRSPSPEDGAAILDAIVESYQSFLGETFEDVSTEAINLITNAKDELANQVKDLETAFREFRENSPLLWKGDQAANIHQHRLEQLETELATVRTRRMQAQARLEVIEEALGHDDAKSLTPIEKLALLSEDDVGRLGLLVNATREDRYSSEEFLADQPKRSELARAEADRLLTLRLSEQQLLQRYGADHPQVEEVREQIKVAQEYLRKLETPIANPKVNGEKEISLAELVTTHIGLLKHDVQEMLKRESSLEKLAENERDAAKKLATDELKGETMKAELDRTKELYAAVLERLREINLVKDYGGYITEVITPVEIPDRAVSPKLLLTLALGGVLGTFLGCGLAYIVDIADRTFRSPLEVRNTLNLPIVGQLPLFQSQRKKATVAASSNGKPIVPLEETIVCYHRARSRAAEAVRGLRTALYFSTQAHGYQVIQVTSPNPSDGKTTMIVNLAVSIAQSGKKVLLLDADLRKPRIESIFGIKQKMGLSTVLVGQTELSDAICRTGIEGLSILPCGPLPPNPSELLTLANFENLLEIMKREYDIVLIDSPPVLAVSDPSVIAPRVDGVLLVVRITKNGRPDVVRARGILSDLGANILGVIVNEKDQPRSYTYGHYGSDRYGYGYGHHYGQKDYGYLEEEASN
ncbi:MAG: polysaccharide biosynthesis tyrosine autokinase [Pirellulales bacterium]|nr:polysaccharide biosynthesis tyrosine autokinase [Pirellulales bacterium]